MMDRLFCGKKKITCLAGLVGLLIVAGFFFLNKREDTKISSTKIARVDLQKVLEKRPDWDRYVKIGKDLDALRHKWAQKNQPIQGEPFAKADNFISDEFSRQTDTIERNFNDENRMKLDSMNNALKEFIQKQTGQLNAMLSEELQNINNAVKNDIQNKLNESDKAYQAYLSELQTTYQVSLSNLQLQLSMADLAANQTDKSDKAKIQAEIEQQKNDLEQKKAVKQGVLQSEAQTYAENRKKEAQQKFEAYKALNESKTKANITAYRKRLENEYLLWQKQRAQNFESAQKQRQKDQVDQYRKDNARETLLKLEQEQWKETAMWEIRQKIKTLARTQRIDCVVAGEIVNRKLLDLTSKLK